MVVLHTNGIHEVDFQYCGCTKAEPQYTQLLRRRFYPATQHVIQTCATFQLLDHLHKLSLTTKAATYDFYRALEKMTDNTGLKKPLSRYRALFRMCLQWRHLKLLKWGGRGHDPTGPDGTKPGELGLQCPSCARPGINIPDGWEKAPDGMKFLYMLFACMDANFRLKNQLVSTLSQDPGLGPGLAYMIPCDGYNEYIKHFIDEAEMSTCVGFQALAQANTRFSKGLRYTGVGGVFCGRSEMVFPNGIGNLQKGERYSNMDYIFASAIQEFSNAQLFVPLLHILISYDIACQWFINLFSRLAGIFFPSHLRPSPSTTFTPAVPKLHEPMHRQENHQMYSLNFIPGVGQSDLEMPERAWSGHNALGNSTKTMGEGPRSDFIDDHFSFWNYLKYISLGLFLSRKYHAALAYRNQQVEAHRGMSKSILAELLSKWEKMCIDWEKDSFPKTKKNPYVLDGIAISEAEVRKEMAREEEESLQKGLGNMGAPSPAHLFISTGLAIEETQRRIQRLAKDLVAQATATQAGGLTEQRNALKKRIRQWEGHQGAHMPGLSVYLAAVNGKSTKTTTPSAQQTPNNPQPPSEQPKNSAALPEHHTIWLPSLIPQSHRNAVCPPSLSNIEERLRESQCTDSLDMIRHTLKMKSRLIKFKNDNIRGQREGTRSRAIIDRVHEKARAAAAKYRKAREAKLALAGPGNWEKKFQPLLDGDIRGYQDANLLKRGTGRKGIIEDERMEVEEAIPEPPVQTEDFSLLPEERSKRDGTGETRRLMSWIWLQSAKPTDDGKGEGDEILMVEWCKSRARANRAREEMRRTLAYLQWKSRWWVEKENPRPEVDRALKEALRAYAITRSIHQKSLASSFRSLWLSPLKDFNPDAMVDLEDNDEGEEELAEEDYKDEDNDDDEEEEEEEEEEANEYAGGYTMLSDDDDDY
ncbi:hypothetical protein CVT24_002863 [Panaeolus cyanescens]|uniref:CxC2-like cysteine cluster KDZ transposase-associated domain-containing protein n=1 Tax=Panaeolus cyanescens TaxID=181874 RepID=A0A409YRK1_9AGAR|nr:hypothetical protein CVT24_002863 [Panaeolus cyanescens]